MAIADSDMPFSDLLKRVPSRTLVYACIHAVSERGVSADVRVDDLEWAAAWKIEGAKRLLTGAAVHMAGGAGEKLANRIVAYLKQRGTVSMSALTQAIRGFDPRDWKAAMDYLSNTVGVIEIRRGVAAGGRPPKLVAYTGD